MSKDKFQKWLKKKPIISFKNIYANTYNRLFFSLFLKYIIYKCNVIFSPRLPLFILSETPTPSLFVSIVLVFN